MIISFTTYLNKYLLLFLLMAFSLRGYAQCVTVGQSLLGGVVIYVDPSALNGLIASATDQSSSCQWGCSGLSIAGAFGTSWGSGLVNTNLILSQCSTAGIAAHVAEQFVNGIYSDWYLPSIDELNLIYLQKVAGNLSNFTTTSYWTSNQFDASEAYSQNFSNGVQEHHPKNQLGGVRAIRTFSLPCCPSTNTYNVTACDYYTWSSNNITYTSSGAFTCTSLNMQGCVDTSILNLIIQASTSTTSNVLACDSYTWNGITYTSSGVYTNTSVSSNGCPQSETLILTVNASTTTSNTISACGTYTWYGITYTASGIYTNSSINAFGCSQVETLLLTITPSTQHGYAIEACGSSYTWLPPIGNGVTYNASGTYTYVDVCHTKILYLTLLPVTSGTTTTVSACDHYEWTALGGGLGGDGGDYTVSGQYIDSTYCVFDTLNLTIYSSPNIAINSNPSVLCSGSSSTLSATGASSYIWQPGAMTGSSVVVAPSNTTIYTVIGTDMHGCTSATTVTIIANQTPQLTSLNNITLCNGDSSSMTSFTSIVADTRYVWTNSNSSIGLDSSGIGSIPAFLATNNGSGTASATITVTPATYTDVVFIPGGNADSVYVLNTKNNQITHSIPVSGNPSSACVNPYNQKVYICNYDNASISVMDLNNYSIVSTISVGLNPRFIAISPNGDRAYVANWGSNNVSVINTLTNQVISTISVGNHPYSICVNPLLNRAYVANNGTSSVSVINTQNNTIVVTKNISGGVTGLAIHPDGSKLYIASSNKISTMTTANNTILTPTITIGSSPKGICLNSSGSRLYANCIGNHRVYIINTLSNTIESFISVPNANHGICITSDNQELYLPGFNEYYMINLSTQALSTIPDIYTNALCLGNLIHSFSCSGVPDSFTIEVYPNDVDTNYLLVCESYTWLAPIGDGNTYTTSGIYVHLSNGGCHKEVLALSILHGSKTTTSATACDSYVWAANGVSYTTSGIYCFTFYNFSGCIDTSCLDLTIHPSGSGQWTVAECNPYYNWNGATYTASGVYTYSAVNPYGCVMVQTLNLTIANSSSFAIRNTLSGGGNSLPPSNTPNPTSSTAYNPNGYVSYSIGQAFYSVLNCGNGIISQGMQQPVINVTISTGMLNLKFFIEGYYLGNGSMNPVLYLQGQPNLLTDCDAATIQLCDSIFPYGVIATYTGIFETNGNMECTFPATTLGHHYYIVINQRSAIQTWSAFPVLITSNTFYDFSLAITKAYGNNEIDVFSESIYSLYSGDFNQDGYVDLLDLALLFNDISGFAFGYLPTDTNGDGNIDMMDVPIVNQNHNSLISVKKPN